jgi:hypothetical protein
MSVVFSEVIYTMLKGILQRLDALSKNIYTG